MNSNLQKALAEIAQERFSLITTDIDGNFDYANENFYKKSGFTKEEVIGKSTSILRHPKMSNAVFENLWTKIQSGQIWSGDLLNRKKDGSDWYLECSISPLFDENKEITGYCSIYHEIELDRILKIEEESDIDPITSLPNRFRLDNELDKGIEERTHFSLLLCQVDRCPEKDIDRVLAKVGKIFTDTLRKSDFIAKWNKKSLASLCFYANIGQAALVAERVRNLINEHEDPEISQINCSFGIAQFIDDTSKEELITKAEERIESALKSGGNRVCI